jgi:hypothetical protein
MAAVQPGVLAPGPDVTNKQFIGYKNSMDFEKINHSNEQM